MGSAMSQCCKNGGEVDVQSEGQHSHNHLPTLHALANRCNHNRPKV